MSLANQNLTGHKLRVPPGVAPQLKPLAALLKLWPRTLNILARPIKRLFRRQEAPLQEINWPIILGLVASDLRVDFRSS
jgi:hypothetical protein